MSTTGGIMIMDSIFQGNLQDDIDQLIHFSFNLHAFFFLKKKYHLKE